MPSIVQVNNVKYPVTTNILYDICKPFGTVIRIVIFLKSGQLQALVEMSHPDEANKLLTNLNNREIYADVSLNE
jgi:hypothetical protein